MGVVLGIVGVYLALGLCFAVVFVCAGIGRLDHAARGGPIGFRLLMIPGSMVLWPLLAWRWARGREAAQWPREGSRAMGVLRRAHLVAWVVLGPLLLAGLVVAVVVRPEIGP